MQWAKKKQTGFTIVELLIVIVVIAILAAITIVAYNGITQRAAESGLQADLRNAGTKLNTLEIEDGAFPEPSLPSSVVASQGNTFQYVSNGSLYCLEATSGTLTYHVDDTGYISSGACPMAVDGDDIQTITLVNCPTTRIRAVDARDNHTYWVQRLADNECWMLTNLAYAGGGTNTYGDVRTLTDGTGGSINMTNPDYYIVPSTTSYELEPTQPSTSTDGTGQYGYLYNWCGAMGGQATAACQNSTTPTPDVTISSCPAGWRLPVGGPSGQFAPLNTAVNGGLTNTDAGLRSVWLGQYAGSWFGGFNFAGTGGVYWSSMQATAVHAYYFSMNPSSVIVNDYSQKNIGFSVRCVAE